MNHWQIMNHDDGTQVYMKMMSSAGELCDVVAALDQFQTGICTRVVRLDQGQEVWTTCFDQETKYHGNGYTSLSGVLLQPEV